MELAMFINFGIGPLVITNLHWQSLFFIVGGLGSVWSIIWILFVTDSPADDSIIWKISKEERDDIMGILDENKDQIVSKSDFPWKKAVTSTAVWALFLNHFSTNW